jgi:hypothetical protein
MFTELNMNHEMLTNNNEKPFKGLHRNNSPIEQPKDTYYYALNAINDSETGDLTNRVSEPSNELCYEHPENYKTIGCINGENGIKYIFSTDNITSRIDSVDSNCQRIPLVNSTCLNFKTTHPIKGEYRVREGCKTHVYWTDNLNADGQFNVDSPEDYLTDGVFDCNKFRLQPVISPINTSLVQVNNTGGQLPLGVYFFQLEVLDSNLNVFYKTSYSQPVNIYDESINSSYQLIDGGYNIDQYLADVGGVPVTNKSITLNFSNLPSEFKFVRLNIARSITGDGLTIDAVQDATLIAIDSDSLRYTYTGFNTSRGDTNLDYTQTLIQPTNYTTSAVIEQVQNRLVRANITETSTNYSGFQQLANSLTSSYIVDEVSVTDQQALGNPKNPNTYFERIGYMGDEVYAFGIVFVNSGTGEETPSFHIPGREATADDLIDFTITNDNLADVKHLGYSDDDLGLTIPRWKVFNTSQGNGQMGYYESEESPYPLINDCEGNSIYSTFTNQKIRHHRFPCRTVEPHYNSVTKTIKNLGINFSNIVLPTDFDTYYIVRAKRDNFNRTVLDSGLLNPVSRRFLNDTPTGQEWHIEGIIKVSPFFNYDIPYYNFISSKGLVEKEYLNGYITTSQEHEASNFGASGTYIEDGWTVTNLATTANLFTNKSFNRKLDANIYMNEQTTQDVTPDFTDRLLNSSFSNTFNPVKPTDVLPIPLATSTEAIYQGLGWYSLMKVFNDIHSNLSNIIYVKVTDSSSTPTVNVYNGDVFISELYVTDINRLDFTTKDVTATILSNFYVESEINFELRHSGLDCNIKPPKVGVSLYILNKVAIRQEDGTLTSRQENYCREYYGYNKDYSNVDALSIYIPLSQTHDYCNECSSVKPYRVVFSPKSFDEEITDTYRINLNDDYIDLPGHRGEITGIQYKNNQLLVHTTQTTFVLQPNPQGIATDQTVAYLSTGDFLGIPPQELQQTDLGYGGLQDKLATSNSEYGYTWVDNKKGTIHTFNNQLEIISNNGLSQWFRENLRYGIVSDFFNLTQLAYDTTAITHKTGVGTQLVYDDRFKRMLITKKDYIFTNKLKEDFVEVIPNITSYGFITEGVYYSLADGWVVYDNNIGQVVIDFSNTDYFINNSFTMSYSYLSKTWISWHSYLPDFMFNDELYYYTTEDNIIRKHLHKEKYLNFNGVLRPFIIEWVDNQYSTVNLHNVYYHATFEDYNPSLKRYQEFDTFNYTHLRIKNSYQNTGKLSLDYKRQANQTPYANLSLLPNVKTIIKSDANSKIANLYDYSTSKVNTTFDLEQIRDLETNIDNYYQETDINIDYTQSPYNLGYLRDKYHFIKLWYYPQVESVKLIHHLNTTNVQQSIR